MRTDEQMIADIAKAMRPSLFRLYPSGNSAAHKEAFKLARAAHSVIAGKVAELERATRMCLALVDCNVKPDARCVLLDGSEPFTALDAHNAAVAALAPYPERRSE